MIYTILFTFCLSDIYNIVHIFIVLQQTADQDTTDHVTDLDANTPETQMQREKRLRLKVNSELFQEGEKDKKGVPKAFVRKSKLNIYLPQADRDSISTKSSCNNL